MQKKMRQCRVFLILFVLLFLICPIYSAAEICPNTVSIAVGALHIVGLKEDGTVVAVGGGSTFP